MEFVKAMKILNRLCNGTEKPLCIGCPVDAKERDFEGNAYPFCASFYVLSRNKPEELEKILEKWDQEHPNKTMMQDFFEKHPDAPENSDGVPVICPYLLGYADEECVDGEDGKGDCKACWNGPLED